MRNLGVSLYVSLLMLAPAAHAANDGGHGDAHGETLAEGIHDAEHASSGGLPQFDPTWFASQVFWLAVAFLFLYIFFAKKTLPEISSVIENRKNHIQADLESAETLTAEAEAVQALYEQGLETARADAGSLTADVEQEMKNKANDRAESFRKRSEQEIKAAEERIAAAQAKAMEDMNTIAAEVASEAVEKITGISTDVQQAKMVVQNLLGKARAA